MMKVMKNILSCLCCMIILCGCQNNTTVYHSVDDLLNSYSQALLDENQDELRELFDKQYPLSDLNLYNALYYKNICGLQSLEKIQYEKLLEHDDMGLYAVRFDYQTEKGNCPIGNIIVINHENDDYRLIDSSDDFDNSWYINELKNILLTNKLYSQSQIDFEQFYMQNANYISKNQENQKAMELYQNMQNAQQAASQAQEAANRAQEMADPHQEMNETAPVAIP